MRELRELWDKETETERQTERLLYPTSSEIQGQSVGSGETARRKFSRKGGWVPGYQLSPDHFLMASRMPAPDWAQKNPLYYCAPSASSKSLSPFRVFWHGVGSFICHIALLVSRKTKVLFMENLTVNAPRSLRTRRKICHVQVKNQFTRKFVLIECIVVLFASNSGPERSQLFV